MTSKAKKELDALEIEMLRSRLTEAEEALQAISKGMIDVLAVSPAGPQASTPAGGQEPSRRVVELMRQGALSLGTDRRILFSNRRFAELLGCTVAHLVGKPLASFVAAGDEERLAGLFDEVARRPASGELRFQCPDGSLMPLRVTVASFSPSDPQLQAEAEGGEGAMLLTVTDLIARKHFEEVDAAEKFARAVFEQSTDAVVVCDPDGRITKASLAAERLLHEPVAGKLLEDAFPMDVAPPAQMHAGPMSSGQVLALALENRSLHGADAQICLPALRDRHFLLSAGPLTERGGGRTGCILTLTEITDRKRTETQQTMLVAELNHRVKNILAIVQSVAWQTLSANQSPAEFKQAFDGRLRALSLAHDILTQGRWGHVEFEQLVERSLAPYYGADHGPRAEWSGSYLLLPSNMVVPLSMVLHELSTNAAKYGAFSAEHGRVKIMWRTDEGKVRFTWVETGGPPVRAEIKAGFGSKLISRVVSYDLAGVADLDFAPAGFRCTLRFPVPQLPPGGPWPLAAAEHPGSREIEDPVK